MMKNDIVNSKTRLFAILGDPIEHTMSPVIMNYAFRKLDLDNVFLAMKCGTDNVDIVMKALRVIDLAGYVITMPLKELVAPYLDELRDEARISGAVNCIQNNKGRLIGYNTDGKGFWAAIQEKNTGEGAVVINKLFLLGMGGLAKAVATEAAKQGVRDIAAANRLEDKPFIEKFGAFSEKLKSAFPGTRITLLPWAPDQWLPELADADVVMNVTPNGLNSKSTLSSELPYDGIPGKKIFFDALLSASETEFLRKAKVFGHKVVDGIDLLAHQGVYAFNILTGYSVDCGDLRREVLAFFGTKRP